ncbi:ThiF family protein [Sodiomyces alkalinus F11]|uniref:Adenylyltransferase and sulfurtransferase uba4 n=1 Tax=Sodiomyces alkalinus (strain CBS 110278 / VKM F-3762 / F11) TaxID=1314773 RepID=A0A3N2Q2Y4_SODAK|nr:ThiF family protein [Sodiomyces alkalinus F11]ROT41110.1 ThiF family protein [Sodiomyces alkalinus F11]
MNRIEDLKHKIAKAEAELLRLKEDLAQAESEGQVHVNGGAKDSTWKWPLPATDYERYSRQMVIPGVGTKGQLRLKAASVLIVGAGGLGCPAAAYIAGAGVGTLGIVDDDTVETSNLHRQIAHASSRVGMSKVESAITYLKEYHQAHWFPVPPHRALHHHSLLTRSPLLPLHIITFLHVEQPQYLLHPLTATSLNPTVTYHAHNTRLTPENAESIVSKYDLVLDCTDHPAIRYLVSDICVLLRKPLVSASALKTDGQLMVLNYPASAVGDESGGPCYRCVFPRPPPPESVVSCGEGGILGPVVGVMGVLQALEAIKVVTSGAVDPSPPATPVPASSKPSMLLFSGTAAPPFRSFSMRPRKKGCVACSADATLTLEGLRTGAFDYAQFCGVAAPLAILRPDERISAAECSRRLLAAARGVTSSGEDPSGTTTSAGTPVLLDVREREHFDICSIEGAVNVPIATFLRETATPKVDGDQPLEQRAPAWLPSNVSDDSPIYVVCRVGNDSQLATRRLKEMGLHRNGTRFIGDIRGGMRAWKAEVDSTLPFT